MSTDEKTAWCNFFYNLLAAGGGCMFGYYMGYAHACRKKSDSESRLAIKSVSEPRLAIKSDSELSRAIKLAKRTKECTELLGQHEEDIAKIRDGLKQCNIDVIANNNEMEQGLISYQFFQPIPIVSKNIQYGRLLNRIDMADTLTKLLTQYPSISMGSFEDLNSSWTDWEEHHKKIVSLVEEYLPETYACLNESKIRQAPGRIVV